MWFLLLLAALCLQFDCNTAQQCPSVANVNPKSGLQSQLFTVTGDQLQLVANITAPGANVNYTVLNSSQLNFQFISGATGIITVTLSPTDNVNCNGISFTLDIKVLDPRISSVSSTQGQPGTVIKMVGCFPSVCGDNSTTYNIQIGGIDVELLPTSLVGGDLFGTFYVRLVPVETTILNAAIELISQYGTVYLLQDHDIDYQQSGAIVTNVTPSSGQNGTLVTITGSNLIGLGDLRIELQSVSFGGVPAQIINSSQTEIIVRVASGTAGNKTIQLNSTQYSDANNAALNGPWTNIPDVWNQLDNGVVTLLVPPAAEPNTTLFICGTSLLGGGSNIVQVLIAGTPSNEFSSTLVNFSGPGIPSECITAKVPYFSEETLEGPVNITADTGALISTQAGLFVKYPNISSVTPSEGQEYTYVTILGSHLLSGYTESEVTDVQVFFGEIPAVVFSYSPSRIVARPSSTGVLGQLVDVQINAVRHGLNFTVSRSNVWTYLTPGQVVSIEPSDGQYGTYVNITGDNLVGYGTGIETVRILGSLTGDVDNDPPVITTAISSSDSSVLVSIPLPANESYIGPVDIVLVSGNGAQVTGRNMFRYRERGRIETVSPTQGQRGTYVTITGFELFGYGSNVSTVRFGDVEAEINYTVSSSSSITVRIGSNTVVNDTLVNITVISDTNAIVKSANSTWTYLREGEIISVTPSRGQFGSLIIIRGTNLLGGGASVSNVYMDGVIGTAVSSNSSVIAVRLGDHTTREIDVTLSGQVYIESNTGAIVSGGTFQQLPPGAITSFSPVSGRQGTFITITGFNLTGHGAAIVTLTVAGYESLSDTYQSNANDSEVIVQAGFAPNGTTGPIRITIDTGAIIESNTSFTYIEPGNIVTVVPAAGTEGTGILIVGTYLRVGDIGITDVTIGGAEVSRIVTASPNQLLVIAGPPPSGNLSSLPIRITSSDGSYVEGGSFSYQNLSLSVIGQDSGQYGTQVTLEVPFPVVEVKRVYIGNQEATIVTSFTQSNSTVVVVTVPRAQRIGQYTTDIAVENIEHIVARLPDGFTYLPEGSIFFVSPTFGQRGTRVTLTGERLLGGGVSVLSVTIGGVATSISNYSDSFIDLSLAGNPSEQGSYPFTADITIVSDTGAIVVRLQGFTFVRPGEITSISPSMGQYGTIVTLEGMGLLQENMDVVTAFVAGIEANVIGVTNDTFVQLQLMPSSPEAGNVTLVLTSGAKISSNALQFRYIEAGAISNVLPSVGTVGTTVRIFGTYLRGGGTSIQSVTLDGTPAAIVTDSNSQLIVRAGLGNATGSAGLVEIISNTGSIVTLDGSWTYEELGTIASISPESGQQGVNVVINGVALGSNITKVTLAGVPAIIVSQSNSTIEVIAGYSSTEQSGPVVITDISGPVITSSSNWFYYKASFDSINPTSGVNGTYVVLNGTNLTGEPDSTDTVSSVTFGSIPAYDIVVLSRNLVRVRVGHSPIALGPVDVQINSTSGAFLTLQSQWYYREPGVITSVEPSVAQPGDNVTIYGTSLVPNSTTGVTVVTGEGVSFRASTINSSVVQFRVGAGPNETVPILIIANDGSTLYSPSPSFTVLPVVAIVTSVTPSAGGEGSVVSINGTDLLNGGTAITGVYLAGVPVSNILSSGVTNIVVVAGAGSDTVGDIVVESNNGLLYRAEIGGTKWSYLPALDTSDVSPVTGRNGTIVSINVSSIPSQYYIDSVMLGGIEAKIESNDSTILVVTAASNTSSGNIVLYFQDGVYLNIFNSWISQAPINITNASTLVGYYRTLVTFNGLGFQGGAAGVLVQSVTLAGFNSIIISQNDTQLTVQINEDFDSSGIGNITGPIIIQGADGSVYNSAVSQNMMFTYLQVSIDSVSPSNGQYGTIVSIKGSGLLAGGSGVSSVTLAGIEVTAIVSTTDAMINVIAAASDAEISTSNIVYITDTGAQVTIPNSWNYVPPGIINSVTPTSGKRGTIVTVTGQGMLGGGDSVSSVLLSGVATSEVLVSHNDFIQVRAGGSNATLIGQVVVTANTGAQLSSNLSQAYFQYLAPAVVASFNPVSGQYGTEVIIEGLLLYTDSGLDHVLLNGVRAAIVSPVNQSFITVIAERPSFIASSQGTVTVVSRDGSIAESAQNFTYLREGEIYSIQPERGQRESKVIVRGQRLRGGGSHIVSASIAGIPAAIITENDTVVQLVIGDNPASEITEITGNVLLVSDTGAQVIRLAGWTYEQVGIISSLSPTTGQYGTYVTVTGERLTAGGVSVAQVFIGNTAALEVVSSNESVVLFRAGEPNVTNEFSATVSFISNDDGNLTTNVSWTYAEESQISQIQPANSTGGSIVNITGSRLLGGGSDIVSVILAGIEVRSILTANDSLIEIETGFNPDGQEKTGDIIIESDTGALTVLLNGWTYISECPIGQYGNNTNSCSPCHPQCDHCFGPSEYNCYDCRNFRILHAAQHDLMECVESCPSLSTLDKMCVDECMTFQYQMTSTLDGYRYCQNCSSLCDPYASCSGPYPSQCGACAVYSENATCVAQCSMGTYVANKMCLPCSEQCLPSDNCFGPEPTQCYTCLNVSIARAFNETSVDECIPSCPSNHYVDESNRCRMCDSLCLGDCYGPLSTQCIECSNASIHHPNDTVECVADCNPILNVMYRDPLTGQCQPCHQYCSVEAGCTGPLASDCLQCSNFSAGANTVATEFIPRLDGECISLCPNESYYVDLRNGNCELCHHSCTIGCTGPSVSDCIVPTESPTITDTTANVGAFSAGIGVVIIVVVIIALMLVVFILVVIVMVVKLKSRGDYKVDNDFDEEENRGRGNVRLEPTAYTRSPVSETNLNEDDDSSTPEAQIRRYVRRPGGTTAIPNQHASISEINPAYIDIELNEEDETSLARSREMLHTNQVESPSPPASPDRPSSPDETTALIAVPPQRPAIPQEQLLAKTAPKSQATENPYVFSDSEEENTTVEVYTEMDNPEVPTQEEYCDMDVIAQLPSPSDLKLPIQEVPEALYEETDSAMTGFQQENAALLHRPPKLLPKSQSVPHAEVRPALPPRAEVPPALPPRAEVRPALPPRQKKGRPRSTSGPIVPQPSSQAMKQSVAMGQIKPENIEEFYEDVNTTQPPKIPTRLKK